MSTDRWMDKEDVVHIYNGILLSHKKEWNNAICINMDGPGNYHSEWSKSDREGQISYDITYMRSIKKWYKWTYLQKKFQQKGPAFPVGPLRLFACLWPNIRYRNTYLRVKFPYCIISWWFSSWFSSPSSYSFFPPSRHLASDQFLQPF